MVIRASKEYQRLYCRNSAFGASCSRVCGYNQSCQRQYREHSRCLLIKLGPGDRLQQCSSMMGLLDYGWFDSALCGTFLNIAGCLASLVPDPKCQYPPSVIVPQSKMLSCIFRYRPRRGVLFSVATLISPVKG